MELPQVLILIGGQVVNHYSAATTACIFLTFFVLATVGNALHMSFHVRNFHLERFLWYRELRAYHTSLFLRRFIPP
eukprot:m.202441 g.202441  ORF g.202441 m.202441 type:complete len:76 (+) comp25246_c0_seq9:1072-1299(+)